MPLAEIRLFLREPTVELLEEYERRVTDEFAERRRVLRYMKRILLR
jgi:ribosomal protein S17E